MYSEVQIMVICNNHEYDVLMNGNGLLKLKTRIVSKCM
jgi:hypothetical protein